jgi:hypothetical protein
LEAQSGRNQVAKRAESGTLQHMKTALPIALLCLLSLGASPARAAESFKVGPFTFEVPEGWTKVTPTSPMRNAQLEIARGHDKAEITFFHFGGGSGTPAGNIARWFGQFPGSEEQRKTESTEVGGVKITIATTEGTFSSGMPGGPTSPMPGYALCGAILEHPGGDVYVKMTGPAALVKSSTETLKKMVADGAKTSGGT